MKSLIACIVCCYKLWNWKGNFKILSLAFGIMHQLWSATNTYEQQWLVLESIVRRTFHVDIGDGLSCHISCVHTSLILILCVPFSCFVPTNSWFHKHLNLWVIIWYRCFMLNSHFQFDQNEIKIQYLPPHLRPTNFKNHLGAHLFVKKGFQQYKNTSSMSFKPQVLLLNFHWWKYSKLNNFCITCLNIMKSPWWTPIHQRLFKFCKIST
jgi:hypothetical protein